MVDTRQLINSVQFEPTLDLYLPEKVGDLLSPSSGSNIPGYSLSYSYTAGTSGRALQTLRSVIAAPYNATADGSTNDSAAIQAAATAGTFVTPNSTILMDTAVVGEIKALCIGTTFTGSNPLDGQYPAFGPGVVKAIAKGSYINGIVGIAHNTAPASTTTFPAGITGYGRNDNDGNHVFGLYAEARQYALTGAATNEIDSFNHTAAPSSNLPPDLAIGTSQNHPIGLQIGAGGTQNSSIGLHICQEGSSPQKFLTGIYINPAAVATHGLYIGSTSTSTFVPATIQHAVGKVGISLVGVGTPVAANSAMTYTDGSGNIKWALKQNGQIDYASSLFTSTVGAAGAAAALPATPAGYLSASIGGVNVKIPCYAP